MPKATPDAIMDAMANAVRAAITVEHVCSGEPANFAGIAAVTLANVAMVSGDIVSADGDTNGRKFTMAQKSAVPITASGTATHVALASGSVLLYVTTCTSQVLTAAGTVTIPAWKVEIADPV